VWRSDFPKEPASAAGRLLLGFVVQKDMLVGTIHAKELLSFPKF